MAPLTQGKSLKEIEQERYSKVVKEKQSDYASF